MGKAETFHALHAGEPFVIPNPWDAGSAKVLAKLGFNALAPPSSLLTFSLGARDGDVTLDEGIEHTRTLAAAVEVPVSVDLEHGYGSEPDDAARAVAAAADAGAAGGSIEDFDPSGRIYDLDYATERVAAAADAAGDFVLTARAENHIRGNPDLDDTIARLQAYERAGADVLYAPGLATVEEIRAACDAVAKPVNVLARPDLSFADITSAGAQRVSVGGALTWVAAAGLISAAERIRDDGDFTALRTDVKIDEWL